MITGFRVGAYSAQQQFAITPDLTTLGKIIGGGMPVGAFGGSRDIMEQLAPQGPVYQAGTLSGNPVTMAAGLATLNVLTQADFYQPLAEKTQQLISGLKELAEMANIPLITHACGSLFGLFFKDQEKITCFDEVMQCDTEQFKQFFHHMLANHIYLAPSAFESGFMSAAHDGVDIATTLAAAEQAFKQMHSNTTVTQSTQPIL